VGVERIGALSVYPRQFADNCIRSLCYREAERSALQLYLFFGSARPDAQPIVFTLQSYRKRTWSAGELLTACFSLDAIRQSPQLYMVR
jgi:hypothetical protein